MDADRVPGADPAGVAGCERTGDSGRIPGARVIELTLEPDEPTPSVAATPGRVTTLSFATGMAHRGDCHIGE